MNNGSFEQEQEQEQEHEGYAMSHCTDTVTRPPTRTMQHQEMEFSNNEPTMPIRGIFFLILLHSGFSLPIQCYALALNCLNSMSRGQGVKLPANNRNIVMQLDIRAVQIEVS
jgi:hypothetical protein